MSYLDPDYQPGDGERSDIGCLLLMLTALVVGIMLALAVLAW